MIEILSLYHRGTAKSRTHQRKNMDSNQQEEAKSGVIKYENLKLNYKHQHGTY